MPHISVFKWFVAIFTIAFSQFFGLVHAQSSLVAVPALSAQAIDLTDTLTAAQLQALQQQLAQLEHTLGSQVVVLMLPSTAPEDVAAFAHRVADQWKIGRKEVGDGILIVVAKDDRRMRIEVAKALEGAITDIAAARIIDSAMKPAFQRAQYAEGLHAAVGQIEAHIQGEALPTPSGASAQAGSDRPSAVQANWSDLAIFLFGGVMVLGPIVRMALGKVLGGLVLGGAVGALAFGLTASWTLAILAGLLACIFTALFSGKGRWPPSGGGFGGGRAGSIGWGGGAAAGAGWGRSSGGSWGGGYSSGGGGNFGGGGASGGW